MKFAYEDLSPTQFEHLVILICQKLLGIGVQGFADGADGGRDAKFHGTAERLPSVVEPWKGKTIIQAKHTIGYNRHFGEKDFFSPDDDQAKPNSAIGKEIPRIARLRQSGDLDNYMLWSNRRLTGGVESKIVKHISEKCDIPELSISLFGLERIEMLLVEFANIASKVNLNPIDSPLIISSDELAIVIQEFAKTLPGTVDETASTPTSRFAYADKNELNNLSKEYADNLRRRYLKETAQIQKFLAAPENDEIRRRYDLVAEEFNFRIIAHRQEFESFDRVLEYILKMLYDRDPILKQFEHKRLTRVMLFYMYWNCDIGRETDVAS